MLNVTIKEDFHLDVISKTVHTEVLKLPDEVQLFRKDIDNQYNIREYRLMTSIKLIRFLGLAQINEVDIIAIPLENTDIHSISHLKGYKSNVINFEKVIYGIYEGNPHGMQMFQKRMHDFLVENELKATSSIYTTHLDINLALSGKLKDFKLEAFFGVK